MALWFRKQPSGGRGEYEVVGEHGEYNAASLTGVEFRLETGFGTWDTQVTLTEQGGKHRLRLTNTAGIHIQRQIAALYLLPKCTRDEESVSHGLPVVIARGYILDIEMNLLEVKNGFAVVEPVLLRARSGDLADMLHRHEITIDTRTTLIDEIFEHREKLPHDVKRLLEGHRLLCDEAPSIGKELEAATEALMVAMVLDPLIEYLPGADPVPTLAYLTGVGGLVDLPRPDLAPASYPEVRLRIESIYRMARMRGPEASRFRAAVQKAYDFRCTFCGIYLPGMKHGARPGVDAAHILPWGTYDLDVVQNGLMLCKLHHWAFDNHVLRLSVTDYVYSLTLDTKFAEHVSADSDTVERLSRCEGPLPVQWLPNDKHNWPEPEFIAKLYAC